MVLTLPGCAVAQTLPTQITSMTMTADSKAFPGYQSGDTAETLISDHTNYDSAHNCFLMIQTRREEPALGRPDVLNLHHALRERFLNSDAIVIATPFRRESALTDTHQFVFSEYEAVVRQVYHSKINSVVPGQQIVLSRAGGVTTFKGQNVRGIDPEFPLLRLNQSYILFLHLDRSSGSFRLFASDVFMLQGDQITAGRQHSKTLPGAVENSHFVATLKSAIEGAK